MASNRPPVEGARPPRPRTPVDYVPTPVCVVSPTDTFEQLLNEEQKRSNSFRVHRMMLPRDQFVSFSQLQLAPDSPRTTASTAKRSWLSGKSVLDSARRKVSSSLDLSKAALEKTKPVVQSAVTRTVTRGKKALFVAAKGLSQAATKTLGLEDDDSASALSRASGSSSHKSLYHRRRLPKLQIPELHISVEKALNSACSTETEKSPSFRILEMSPTSRDLEHERRGHDSEDIEAEFHNMLSARRRIRKSSFGQEVARYQQARSTWDEPWLYRIQNDNHEDRQLLRQLTDALQEQKDHATRLVQKNPGAYPGLEHVSDPGCTLKLYWQHKSSYR
ncbi:hypothetical protein F5Y14DRAFT_434300 [Nemania sp. NC0429]|nr:hypothetical protein F5Y14DRAFT_434300 [Nemania sp. NC0429]